MAGGSGASARGTAAPPECKGQGNLLGLSCHETFRN